MSKSIKKLFSLVLAGCMTVGMCVSASAATIQLFSRSSSSPTSHIGGIFAISSVRHSDQELNVFGTIANNRNVTTWPVNDRDDMHKFILKKESGVYYSLRCNSGYNYAVEHYYGASNRDNCDIYNTTAGSAYISTDDYYFALTELNNYCRMYLKDGNRLPYTGAASTYAGKTYYDVRWHVNNSPSSADNWVFNWLR